MKSRFLFALLVSAWCLPPATAKCQTFPTFDEVNFVTVQDFSVFQAIWDKAQNQNVRIALFGDSQETSPGGAGNVYIPSLNHEFYQHFGKVGESFVAPGIGSFGGGSPAAEWLLQGSFGSSLGHFPGELSSDQILPGQTTRSYTSSALGQGTLLDTSNSNVAAGGVLGQVDMLWQPEDIVSATIFGVSSLGSDEFSWRAASSNGRLNFFLPIVSTGTTSIGLDSLPRQILSEDSGPIDFGGANNRQLIVRGSGSNGAELVGVRFHNLSTPGGVSIQDFSAGGYRTTSFLANHSDAGAMLLAFGEWDAILIHTGANDAYSGLGTSAVQFQSDVADLIAAIRGPQWLDNPDQKFILVTDPYRDQGPVAQNIQFDQYAGALAELALDDPNIMAVNSRRVTDGLGWNMTNPSEFLSDIVHYTPSGARLLAAVEAQLILNGGLLGDFDRDNDVDIDDIDFYAGNIGSAAAGALSQQDLDGDGTITLDDLQTHIETYVQTSNGEAGTFLGDLNLDGSVTVLDDAFILISNLNGSATSYAQGDLNLDGTVNVISDAFALIGNLGRTNAP